MAAEVRASQLESDLKDSQDLAKRYHNMYLQEKEKSGDRPRSRGPPRGDAKSPRTDSPSDQSSQNKDNQTAGKDGKKEENKEGSAAKGPDRRSKSARVLSRGSMQRTEDNRRSKTAKERRGSGDNGQVTEKDLDDDEALFKRHVEMIAESKAMRTTSPIRVTDVIRKSEVSNVSCDYD